MLLVKKTLDRVPVVPVLGAMLPESGHNFAVLDSKEPPVDGEQHVYEVEVYRVYHNPSELVAVGFRLEGREKFLFDSTGKLIPSRKDDPYIGRLWLMQVREVQNSVSQVKGLSSPFAGFIPCQQQRNNK